MSDLVERLARRAAQGQVPRLDADGEGTWKWCSTESFEDMFYMPCGPLEADEIAAVEAAQS